MKWRSQPLVCPFSGEHHCPGPPRERFPSAGTDDRKRPPLRWLYRVISNELPSSFRCVQVRAWIAKISVNENIQIRYTQR